LPGSHAWPIGPLLKRCGVLWLAFRAQPCRRRRTDEYYWADLLGLEVRNTREQSLGRILGLIETPANAVLRVGDGESATSDLLPFVAAVVLDVDLAERRVRVEWET
jgi:16S rRNA processing protein RimM